MKNAAKIVILLCVFAILSSCSTLLSTSKNEHQTAVIFITEQQTADDKLFICGYLDSCQELGMSGSAISYDPEIKTDMLGEQEIEGLVYADYGLYASNNKLNVKQILRYDADTAHDEQEYTSAAMVIVNYEEMGGLSAKVMIEKLNDRQITEGTVVLPAQSGMPYAAQYSRGFINELKKSESNLTVYESFLYQSADGSLREDLLTDLGMQPDIVGFSTPWCEQISMYMQAAKQLQISNPVLIGGQLNDQSAEWLETGVIDAVIAPSPYDHGRLCAERLKAMLDGESVTKESFQTFVPTQVWTTDNLNQLKLIYSHIDE